MQTILKTEKSITPEQEASKLQILLNFLILEEDLCQIVQPLVGVVFQIDALIQKIREGNCQVIRLSALSEALIFEIPVQFEQTEEMAFWLSFSSYFDLRKEKDKIYVCIKPIEKWQISLHVLEQKLNHLKTQTHNDKILILIDKFLYCLKVNTLQQSLVKKLDVLNKYFTKITCFALRKRMDTEDLEREITPAFYFLIASLKTMTLSVQNMPRDLPIENFKDIKKIIDFWMNHRPQQIELFELASTQLRNIVQAAKRKSEFLKYTKDLIEDYDSIPLKMREHLSVEKAQEVKFEQQKLPPALPNLTREKTKSKKKTKSKSSSHTKLIPLSVIPISFEENQHQQAQINPEKEPSLISSTLSPSKGKDLKEPFALPAELPGEIFPYFFDERVERWHRYSLGEPLPANEFSEYSMQTVERQELMHVFHALNPMVDRFISLGIQDTWQNARQLEDLRFVLPAEITYKGEKYRGLIAYAIDKETNICYHKYFCEKFASDMLSEVMNRRFNEHDFPPLNRSTLAAQTIKSTPFQTGDAKVTINNTFGSIVIQDSKANLQIELFRIQ